MLARGRKSPSVVEGGKRGGMEAGREKERGGEERRIRRVEMVSVTGVPLWGVVSSDHLASEHLRVSVKGVARALAYVLIPGGKEG